MPPRRRRKTITGPPRRSARIAGLEIDSLLLPTPKRAKQESNEKSGAVEPLRARTLHFRDALINGKVALVSKIVKRFRETGKYEIDCSIVNFISPWTNFLGEPMSAEYAGSLFEILRQGGAFEERAIRANAERRVDIVKRSWRESRLSVDCAISDTVIDVLRESIRTPSLQATLNNYLSQPFVKFIANGKMGETLFRCNGVTRNTALSMFMHDSFNRDSDTVLASIIEHSDDDTLRYSSTCGPICETVARFVVLHGHVQSARALAARIHLAVLSPVADMTRKYVDNLDGYQTLPKNKASYVQAVRQSGQILADAATALDKEIRAQSNVYNIPDIGIMVSSYVLSAPCDVESYLPLPSPDFSAI